MFEFVFQDISYSIRVIKGQSTQSRMILDGIQGRVSSGEVLGILGPSGAGKSSLLHVLTLNALSGISEGLCTLNSIPLTSKIFTDHCCIVPQEDHHRAFLTCRDTIMDAANFYLNASDEEKKQEVDLILQKLGLEGCADTRVGNQFLPGLSGGQKKRLSVALALLKKPALMLLDEPTSGLDAAASHHVMTYIHSVARDLNTIVICTIHQPSSFVYMNLFDKVMLLSEGRQAFWGSPEHSVNYFASLGYETPHLSNPAEYFLGIINAEFTDPASVDDLIDHWAENEAAEIRMINEAARVNQKNNLNVPVLPTISKISFINQLKYVGLRQIKISVTDPMIYVGRAVMFLIACTFFAVIYVKSRDRNQEQVLNRLFLCMWLVAIPSSLGVIGVYAFNEEFKTLQKEVKNGMFSIWAYLWSVFVLQIPIMGVLALFAVGISGFGVANMYIPKFVYIIGIYAAILFTYESMARSFSVAFDNPLLGMLNFLQVWFTSFVFAGVMIPENMVIWPFRIFCYIMPLKWGIGSIAWLDAYYAEYDGARLCYDEDNDTTCIFHYDNDGNKIEPGWSCADTVNGDYNPLQCYGREGEQVLDSLGMNYAAIESSNNVARNFGIMMAIALVFQFVYMFQAAIKANKSSFFVTKDITKYSKIVFRGSHSTK
jgi:ABC-type multidrug transport system ATPase subunit